MRTKLLLIILSLSLNAYAGNEVGNGGYKLVLKNGKHILLDRWDAQRIHGYTIDLGNNNSVKDKLQIMLDRLARVSPPDDNAIPQTVLNIEEHSLALDNETIICNNDSIIGEHISHKLDIGKTVIPSDAKLVPVARNLRGNQAECSINSDVGIYFYKNNMRGLSNDDIAMLYLHEVLYSKTSDTNSYSTRHLVGLLASSNADQMTDTELVKAIIDTGYHVLLTINGFQIKNVESYKAEGERIESVYVENEFYFMLSYRTIKELFQPSLNTTFCDESLTKTDTFLDQAAEVKALGLDTGGYGICRIGFSPDNKPQALSVFPADGKSLTLQQENVSLTLSSEEPIGFIRSNENEDSWAWIGNYKSSRTNPTLESLKSDELEIKNVKVKEVSFHPSGKLKCVDVSWSVNINSAIKFKNLDLLKGNFGGDFKLCLDKDGNVEKLETDLGARLANGVIFKEIRYYGFNKSISFRSERSTSVSARDIIVGTNSKAEVASIDIMADGNYCVNFYGDATFRYKGKKSGYALLDKQFQVISLSCK
jgi:hypothetical protein